MGLDELKQLAAKAALQYVPANSIVGVGTGSTTNHFIAELVKLKSSLKGAVASSTASATRLVQIGIRVLDLNDVTELPVYVDGADEITASLAMIKGGGGALTREKIVAAVARKFICIADESKLVTTLGNFPLPVEVIPMARAYVARELARFGGKPVLREGFTTDNGNVILDVHELTISDPRALEGEINQIVGVVSCGIFARRPADTLLLGTKHGLETLTR